MDFRIRVIENIGEDSEEQFGPPGTILDVVHREIISLNGVIWCCFENIQDINNYFSEEDEYETVFTLVPGKQRPVKVTGEMKLNEYQERSKRTLNVDNMTRRDAINQMLLGMSEEAGECQGIFKKHFYQGHKLDIDEVIQEMGDTLFYLSGLATVLGLTLEEVAEGNIAKLKKRYPDGFDAEKSINREC